MKTFKLSLFFVYAIIVACFYSCSTLKKIEVKKLPYADIVEAINYGLSESKSVLVSSDYLLKSGSIKLYSASNTSAGAGVDFWVIESGYKWTQEKASSITFNFTNIEDFNDKDKDAFLTKAKIEPADFKKLIETAITNFNQVESIANLDESGFVLDMKFGIVQVADAKFKLDFGLGANLNGSSGNSVAHEVSLTFEKKPEKLNTL
jgi:hypothetical protein